MKTFFKWLGLAALGVLVLMMTFPDVLLVPFTLLVGWTRSLQRLWAGWNPDRATLGLVLTALLALLGGSHSFLVWLRATARAGDGAAPPASPQPWSWRWTLSLHAGFWLTLLAIVSLVCVTHQVFWMFASKEPVLVSRLWPKRVKADLRRATQVLADVGQANDWEPAKMQTAIWQARVESADDQDALWERHHLILLPGLDRRLGEAIVMPRDPRARLKVGLAVVQPDTEVQFQPAEALPHILAGAERRGTGPAAKQEDRR